jgi:hypothetical protein
MPSTISGHPAITKAWNPMLRRAYVPGRPIWLSVHRSYAPLFLRLAVLLGDLGQDRRIVAAGQPTVADHLDAVDGLGAYQQRHRRVDFVVVQVQRIPQRLRASLDLRLDEIDSLLIRSVLQVGRGFEGHQPMLLGQPAKHLLQHGALLKRNVALAWSSEPCANRFRQERAHLMR